MSTRPMTEEDWARFDAVVRYVAQHAEFWQHAPTLTRGLAELASMRNQQSIALAERLLERLCLLDNVIGEHHASDVMRPGVYACPVCTPRGSGFFYDTANLVERARNLLAPQTSVEHRR